MRKKIGIAVLCMVVSLSLFPLSALAEELPLDEQVVLQEEALLQEDVADETAIASEEDSVLQEAQEDASLPDASGQFKKSTTGKWGYYVSGKLQKSLTGMVKGTINGHTKWFYIKKGVYTKVTGIAQKAASTDTAWYYVKSGSYKKATTIAKRADGSSSRKYYVKDGKLNKKTGNVKIGTKSYPLYKGVVQTSAYRSAYRKVLQEANMMTEQYTPYSIANNVAIKNLGGNSIPELVILTVVDGTSSYNFSGAMEIYTCINGKAIKVKTFDLGMMSISGTEQQLYLMKDGTVCYKTYKGDEYIKGIEYVYYSFKDGRNMKKTKTRKVEFANPTNSSTYPYPMKMYVNGSYVRKVTSQKMAHTAADKKAGYYDNVKGLLMTRFATGVRSTDTFRPTAGTEMNMRLDQAFLYLNQ